MNTSKIISAILLCLTISIRLSAQTLNSNYDPHIESKTKAFLDVLNSGGGRPIEQLTPKEARDVLSGAQASVKYDYKDIIINDKTISSKNGKVVINIIRPAKSKGLLPVFMFIHGGGWVLGDFPTHKRLVRDLVVNSGAAAVFVNYTPSPEAHYPVAINQEYDVLTWIASHGNEIGVDGKRLAVVGNSVGGNMAAVMALMAKNKKGPKIKLQVLLWPVTNAEFETESYNNYATGRFLTKKMMQWFWDNYTTDLAARKEIYASPLQATIDQLRGLPKAIIMVAENDVLRDEGEAYASKLDQAGVEVTSIRYNGMIHDWGLLNPLSEVAGTRSVVLQAADELKKALK
jgi:acetyl esterase